ncbi:MAG: hypothetical protein OER74_13735 [Desulfobacteraceae bacterium]|nr:hypothetical protein [Desulfobacteraceae bacterium]
MGAKRKLSTGIFVVNNHMFFITNKNVSLKFSSSDGIARKRLPGKVYFEKEPSGLGWVPKGHTAVLEVLGTSCSFITLSSLMSSKPLSIAIISAR